MRSTSGKIFFLVLTLGLLLGAAPSLHASTIYNLTEDHCTGGCGPAGTIFGTVTLSDNGPGVDVTVHLNSGFAYAKTGAVDMQAFKFNGSGIVLGDITIDGHTPALTKNNGSFNGNGTGAFVFGISCGSCTGGMSGAFTNDIVFHVANAEISDLTAGNANGYVFVADVGKLSTGKSGPVAAVPQVATQIAVPEPASIGMLGLGFLCVGLLARKKIAGAYQR